MAAGGSPVRMLVRIISIIGAGTAPAFSSESNTRVMRCADLDAVAQLCWRERDARCRSTLTTEVPHHVVQANLTGSGQRLQRVSHCASSTLMRAVPLLAPVTR